MKPSKVAKAITAFIVALAAWAAAALVDGKVSAAEWAQLIGVAATTFAVYMIPNAPDETPAPPAPPAA